MNPLSTIVANAMDWSATMNQNLINIQEALSGIQPIGPLHIDGDTETDGKFDGVDVAALAAYVAEFPAELKNLTVAEIAQLANINANVITTAIWAYIAAMNQALATTSSVVFNDLDITTPVNLWTLLDGRYYTEDEVDEIIAGVLLNYWLSDTADGVIGGYNRLFDTDTGEAQSSIGPITIAADPTTIKAFVTEIGKPALTILSAGVYALDIHAKTTVGANVKPAHLRWYLKKRTHPGGVETPLLTSEDSSALTDAEEHYTLCTTLAEQIEIGATDRLTLLVVGIPEGAKPGDPDVTIYMEGTCASRIAIRTTSAALDARFLRTDGTNAPTALLNWAAQIMRVAKLEIDNANTHLDKDGAGNLVLTDAVTGAKTLAMLTGGMIDRGDPAAWDRTAGWTADDAWHDWDLSAIVPAGAKTIKIRVHLLNTAIGIAFAFRKNGNANAYVTTQRTTLVASAGFDNEMTVACDNDRIIEYLAGAGGTWSRIWAVVVGWWF